MAGKDGNQLIQDEPGGLTPPLSPAELMAIVLSRDLGDGEVGAWGVGSLIPMAAVLLARASHAPHIIIGGERAYNPKPVLNSGLDDPGMMTRIEALEGYWELFGHWHRGVDFFCFSGMQVDAFGNLNLHLIGDDLANPTVRGPGVPNISLAGSCGRTYLFFAEHSKRRFVERLDFISVPGHMDGQGRKSRALKGSGPKFCVTPLCVFEFSPETHRMFLASVHPGVTVSAVLGATGFEIAVEGEVPVTRQPTSDEIRRLREVVDPQGLLLG